MPLSSFDPLIAEWFASRFGPPTEPQVLGWPEIRAGRDVLISAPTGSGKTLAAFLICLDELVREARAGSLPDRIEAVYVSPLKALSHDIRKNLEAPLAEITELANRNGVWLTPIRTAVRTGDTPAWDRQQMIAHPPQILVTTPESLFILLTSRRGRDMLSTARTVIVDEIHAVADDKRGSHLALTLERLDHAVASTGRPKPQRIGLSATVHPIEEVARFLSPSARIINVGHRRNMELAVEVPRSELGPVASNEMWGEMYDRIAALIAENRTTLVFVNTRRLAERVAHNLAERIGEEWIMAHHGSLSRRIRLAAEDRLKKGELKALVATASLELGIDIGTIDLVCQIGSPRAVNVALQRFGRAGHWVGAVSKGRLFATTRDELIECAALIRAIRSGELDKLEIPSAPLDILAQQIVAASSEDWNEEDLFALVRRAYPYRDLERKDFEAVLEILSEGIATSRGRNGALLHRDRVNHRVKGRRGARLAAITSGGAIPDTAAYPVIAEPEGILVGTLDEDFAIESMAGDIFLLGSHSWRIRRVEAGRVRVEDAHGAPPSIPFWNGEAPGRTLELSREVSSVREEIVRLAAQGPDRAVRFLMEDCALDRMGAEQAVDYVRAGAAYLGTLPTQQTVVAERFFDEAGGMQLVIHAPFGSRINRAWGLALRKRFCRSFNLELQAAATDNGIVISLTEQHAFPLEVIFGFLTPQTVEHVLTHALLAAPMFNVRWRWNCTRALAILRFAGGRKVPAPIQRMRADDLMAAVFPDQAACPENLPGEVRIPDHPLVNETIGNCLYEAMDLHGLRAIIEAIRSGEIKTVAMDTAEPSLFSHEILNANPYAYLDDAPLEERRARAVQLRQTLRADVGEAGILDPEVIAEVARDSWPDVRDADELHDALLTLCLLPPEPQWQRLFETLRASRRASVLEAGGKSFWVAAERLEVAAGLREGKEEYAAQTLRGWLESSGPLTVSRLAEILAVPRETVDIGLARLEAEGQVLRGRFHGKDGETEWCNRRILARIHRLTLGRLRREIEPVTSAGFMRFLCRWHHLAPGTQLHGVDGTLQIIRQLQGFEIPAAAWEAQILPRRIARYEPEWLDRLCLSGEVMWGRPSPPASERVRPTRAAPITFFQRDDAGWILGHPENGDASLSHPAAELLAVLKSRGASFFNDLVRSTGRLPSEAEDGLWELVASGKVTADGFENLRALVDPKRRRGEGNGRLARPRHAAGRWALLHSGEVANGDAADAVARQLLRRWGVVFRDLLARENFAPAWRDMLVAFRRLEARGEIRGGRFVEGYVGEQFALPEAVELLRAVRRSHPNGEEILISLADPLNLVGIVLPGPRLNMLGTGTLRLRDGVPVEPQTPRAIGAAG